MVCLLAWLPGQGKVSIMWECSIFRSQINLVMSRFKNMVRQICSASIHPSINTMSRTGTPQTIWTPVAHPVAGGPTGGFKTDHGLSHYKDQMFYFYNKFSNSLLLNTNSLLHWLLTLGWDPTKSSNLKQKKGKWKIININGNRTDKLNYITQTLFWSLPFFLVDYWIISGILSFCIDGLNQHFVTNRHSRSCSKRTCYLHF